MPIQVKRMVASLCVLCVFVSLCGFASLRLRVFMCLYVSVGVLRLCMSWCVIVPLCVSL